MTSSRIPRYLALADVIALHNSVMQRTGHSPAPLRFEGALDSARQRPQAVAYYEDADLIRQSALLAVGISQAKAFLDGNKGTAYATLDVFLRLNELMYSGDPVALAEQLEIVPERTDSLDAATPRFEAWLRAHISPV